MAGSSDWGNYRLVVRMRSDTENAAGVIFRYIDDDNYYRLSLDAKLRYRRLVKKVNGAFTSLWEDGEEGFKPGESFAIAIDVVGPQIIGYINNERLFEVLDPSHTTGCIGLYCWSNVSAHFERVEVLPPALEASAILRDHFSDGDLGAWNIVDEGTANGPSQWKIIDGLLNQLSSIQTPTQPHDQISKRGTQAVVGKSTWENVVLSVKLASPIGGGAIGVLFRYQDANNYYRFSMDSKGKYRRLVKNVGGKFVSLWEDAIAYDVAGTYEFTVVAQDNMLRGYLDGIAIFAVGDDDLVAGQIGLYCHANTTAQFSGVRVYPGDRAFNDWLLDEPFDILTPDRWSFIDEGDQGGPSKWDVAGGELRQTSKISGTAGGTYNDPGTYALAGDSSWTDYRVTVGLRSDDDQSIGVIFRFKDANNYYRFSMNRLLSYQRLIKKVDGVVTLLWEDLNVQYALNREYLLTLDCNGDRLAGYLDGVQLFAIEDNALTSGCIGLYCWHNGSAKFMGVRIASPVWTNYYAFGRETVLPAGMRVRVHAGGGSDNSLPEELNLVRRFSAPYGTNGVLLWPADDSVDLRLIKPGSTILHTRSFLSGSKYSPINASNLRVLRKADGTGFFVTVIPAGSSSISPLAAGQYRLNMTYRRNNQAVDPDSQIFAQSGVTEPEEVLIDIPWSAH